MNSWVGWFVPFLMVGSLLLAGCGGDDGGRATVKGQVTFNGTPINDGAINLVPLDSQGRRVGGSITNGTYELTGEQSGPVPGNYRVEVYGFEPMAAPAGAAAGDAEAESATRQFVPPQFNSQSTIELNVDSSEVEKDFALTT
jgi:hypothetical protein